MRHLATLGVGIFMAQTVSAATVAVIDSGLDVQHERLSSSVWINDGETDGNSQDEDQNGFPDDIYGWNFAENNNLLLDPRFSGGFPEDCFEFFRRQGRLAAGTGTPEDKQWIMNKQKNPLFVAELMRFGNYVHGTHVAGVATGLKDSSKAIGIKIIPTAQSVDPRLTLGEELKKAFEEMPVMTGEEEGIRDTIIRFVIRKVVDAQSGTVTRAIDYAAKQEALVANGSFGVSMAAIKPILKGFLGLFGKGGDEDVKTYATYLIERMNQKASEAINRAPNTVFVFAAGNDGNNNDEIPVSPAGVQSDVVISVAATNGLTGLASFSNYGLSVDVAAPGVNIRSTVPGNRILEMSGTSMAAPYVTHVVDQVRETNPELTSAQVKKLVVETVDEKAFLKGKVKSAGIVNLERAVLAAKLSRTQGLEEAIAQSRRSVADQKAVETGTVLESVNLFVAPLPSPIAL
jgi:subtilisin family serine protease